MVVWCGGRAQAKDWNARGAEVHRCGAAPSRCISARGALSRDRRLLVDGSIRMAPATRAARRKGTMTKSTRSGIAALLLAAACGGATGADLRPVDSFATVADRAERSRALFVEAGKVLQ